MPHHQKNKTNKTPNHHCIECKDSPSKCYFWIIQPSNRLQSYLIYKNKNSLRIILPHTSDTIDSTLSNHHHHQFQIGQNTTPSISAPNHSNQYNTTPSTTSTTDIRNINTSVVFPNTSFTSSSATRKRIFEKCDEMSARRFHSTVPMLNSLYVFAGQNQQWKTTNTLYKFNTIESQWYLVNQDVCLDDNSDIVVSKDKQKVVFKWNVPECPSIIDTVKSDDMEVEEHAEGSNTYNSRVTDTTSMYKGVKKMNVRRKIEIPKERKRHTCVKLDEYVFAIFGGYNIDEDVCMNDLWLYDVRSNRWVEKLKNLDDFEESDEKFAPHTRKGHSAVLHNFKMYIFGGENDQEGCLNDMHSYDFLKDEWNAIEYISKDEVPSAREGHSCCMRKEELILFGGSDGMNDEALNDLYKFDLKKERWTLLHGESSKSRIPCKRHLHSAAYSETSDCMYIFGGYNDVDDIVLNDLHEYDFRLNLWRRIELVINPWYTHNFILNTTDSNVNKSTLLEQLDNHELNSLRPVSCCAHTCTIHNNRLYVLGGEDVQGNSLNQFFFVDIPKHYNTEFMDSLLNSSKDKRFTDISITFL